MVIAAVDPGRARERGHRAFRWRGEPGSCQSFTGFRFGEGKVLPSEFPDFGLTPEERREAVFGHYYEWPGMDGEHGEIWAYTPRFSYRPGEVVTICVSSTARAFQLDVVRDGGEETAMLSQSVTDGRWQDTPEQWPVEGCGWQPMLEFRIGEDWPSGGYRITLTAEGEYSTVISYDHLIIVKPAPGRKAGRILHVAATGTWTAYNTWGG